MYGVGKHMIAQKTLFASAVTAVVLLTAMSARAATNVALAADGASFVTASSHIDAGDLSVMQSDLLTDTKTAWYPDGDTRYIFGANDPSGTIEIDLGHIQQIDSIGASIDLPSDGDRPVIGPFSVEVSTNGVNWSAWGAPVTVDGSTNNPVAISGPADDVRYIEYIFGDTGSYYNDFGGSAVNGIFAMSVPEPASWAMVLVGLAGIGAAMRRQRQLRVGSSPG
jgi:hypothetical protein